MFPPSSVVTIDLCYNECIESCAQRRSGAFSFFKVATAQFVIPNSASFAG
jgi:hypothetical protein